MKMDESQPDTKYVLAKMILDIDAPEDVTITQKITDQCVLTQTVPQTSGRQRVEPFVAIEEVGSRYRWDLHLRFGSASSFRLYHYSNQTIESMAQEIIREEG